MTNSLPNGSLKVPVIQKPPGPRDYGGGERPLSEPEAIAMADLTKQRDFSRVLAFHTQGRVIYWGGFENLEPPRIRGSCK